MHVIIARMLAKKLCENETFAMQYSNSKMKIVSIHMRDLLSSSREEVPKEKLTLKLHTILKGIPLHCQNIWKKRPPIMIKMGMKAKDHPRGIPQSSGKCIL